MTDYERAIVEHIANFRRPRPSLAEFRAREAEGRREWEQDTEQIAATLPELLRDGYRIGRWMQWAGHVLMTRASWAADDVGAEEPNRATWERAQRLLQYAEVVMGAATRWMVWQELTERPTWVIRGGTLEVPEPDPLPIAEELPRPQRLTIARLVDAVGLIAATTAWTPDHNDCFFARGLVRALVRQNKPLPASLLHVAGGAC